MTDLESRGQPLWIAYEYLAMAVGLGSLAVICLGWLPFAFVLNPLLPRRPAVRLGRLVISRGFRVYLRILTSLCACRIDFAELDRLRDQGPLIIAANHPSLLDAVILLSRLPNAVCVMKAALMNNPLFGAAARMARYIRNDQPLEMILTAREALDDGAQLVIFPEGTRTVDFPLNDCTLSTALIASRSGVPVQTVLIEFSTPYLGKAWPLFRRPRLPLDCRIRLGRRFAPPTDVEAMTREIEAYFRSELGQNFRFSVANPQ